MWSHVSANFRKDSTLLCPDISVGELCESYAKSHEMLFFPFSSLHWHYLTSHSFAVLFMADDNIFSISFNKEADFERETLEKSRVNMQV